jgi:hypothetical protein
VSKKCYISQDATDECFWIVVQQFDVIYSELKFRVKNWCDFPAIKYNFHVFKLRSLLIKFVWTAYMRFCGIYIHALVIKIKKYTNKCTILQFKVFTITSKTLELRHFSTLYCGSSLGSVHQYMDKSNCVPWVNLAQVYNYWTLLRMTKGKRKDRKFNYTNSPNLNLKSPSYSSSYIRLFQPLLRELLQICTTSHGIKFQKATITVGTSVQ